MPTARQPARSWRGKPAEADVTIEIPARLAALPRHRAVVGAVLRRAWFVDVFDELTNDEPRQPLDG